MCAAKSFADSSNSSKEVVSSASIFTAIFPKIHIDHLGDSAWTWRHDHYSIRQVDGFRNGVRYKHHSGFRLGANTQQLTLHILASHFVKCAKWLVHQQQRWVGCKCASNGNALLHTARQLPWHEVGKLWEFYKLKHFLCTSSALFFVPTL